MLCASYWRAMWRWRTCAISCASTQANSDSVCAASRRPVLMPMNPPGMREGVHRLVADDEEFEVLARLAARGDQPVAERLHVVRRLRVVVVVAVAADLAHDRFADPPLLLRRDVGLRAIAQVGQVLRPRQGASGRAPGRERGREVASGIEPLGMIPGGSAGSLRRVPRCWRREPGRLRPVLGTLTRRRTPVLAATRRFHAGFDFGRS